MSDTTLNQITDALDRLASGNVINCNGKINSVNLAKESGISKATLYRYFQANKKLRDDLKALKKYGVKAGSGPETIEQENVELKKEVKRLRSKIAEIEREFSLINNVKAHQIFVLHTENSKLISEVEKLENKINSSIKPKLRL